MSATELSPDSPRWMSSTEHFDCGAFLWTAGNFESLPDIIEPFLNLILPRIHVRLVIWIQSDELEKPTCGWQPVHKLLTSIYLKATAIAHRLDKMLLSVDVTLRNTLHRFQLPPELKCDVLFQNLHGELIQSSPDSHIRTLAGEPLNSDGDPFQTAPTRYPVVAMGGTFDHLHAGHKILLSMGAFLASERLIVGVTDDSLLVNKKYKDELETLPERIKNLHIFLNLFNPAIKYDLVPLSDVYGPTGWDPNIQALVVSKETLSGAAAIAKHRAEKALPPLEEFVIDVIGPTGEDVTNNEASLLKEVKMSSTAIRAFIIKSRGEETGTTS